MSNVVATASRIHHAVTHTTTIGRTVINIAKPLDRTTEPHYVTYRMINTKDSSLMDHSILVASESFWNTHTVMTMT